MNKISKEEIQMTNKYIKSPNMSSHQENKCQSYIDLQHLQLYNIHLITIVIATTKRVNQLKGQRDDSVGILATILVLVL